MFSPDFVADLLPEEPPALVTSVNAAAKDVTSVGNLGAFKQLLRLNLENNQLTEFGGLAESATLKQLLLVRNRIAKVPKLDIPQLQV
jgi:Leucine-rich repeat (LRR) protein